MRFVTWMAVLAGAGALMAGCGDDEKTDTTPAATTQAATETAATETETAAETTTEESAEASPGSTERPDADGDGTPDVQTFRGELGDTFTLVGQPGFEKASEEAVEVTVLGVTGPFSGFDLDPGRKLIGIKIRFKGVDGHVFDDPQPNGQLTVTGGETGKQTSLIAVSGKNPCDNPSVKLKEGKSVTSCLAFDIPKNAKPQVFEFATSSGFGDTGIWKLR